MAPLCFINIVDSSVIYKRTTAYSMKIGCQKVELGTFVFL
jgi:hypothetical protein